MEQGICGNYDYFYLTSLCVCARCSSASADPANRCTDVIIIVVMWRWRWIAHLTCNTVSTHSADARRVVCASSTCCSRGVYAFLSKDFFFCTLSISLFVCAVVLSPRSLSLSPISGSGIQWLEEERISTRSCNKKMERKEKTKRILSELGRVLMWAYGSELHHGWLDAHTAHTYTKSLQLYL